MRLELNCLQLGFRTDPIDLGNKYWWPIGMYESTPFCGTFDGNGKVIKNLNVVAEESNPYIPCGLFGYVKGTSTSPVSIRNLGIASGSVSSAWVVGSLVGHATYVTLTNCYNHASVTGSRSTIYSPDELGELNEMDIYANTIGGLVGEAAHTTLTNCYNGGYVNDNTRASSGVNKGSLVGNTATLIHCYWLMEESDVSNATGYESILVSCYPYNGIGKLAAGAPYTYLLDALNAAPWSSGDCNKWKVVEDNKCPTFDTDESKVTLASTSWYSSSSSSFTISTATELAGLAKLVNEGVNFSNKKISLKANIDLAEHLWIPIGVNSSTSFKGTFEGNGWVIRDLKVEIDGDYAGLFGCVDGEYAVIRNLGIVGGWVQGTKYVGSLVAEAKQVSLTNCYNHAEVVGSGAYTGGLVGDGSSFTLENCYNSGSVQGGAGTGSYIGGLVGWGSSATLTNCYNSGSVDGDTGSNIGGLVGRSSGTTPTLTNCYWLKTTAATNAIGNGTVGTTTNCDSFDADGKLTNAETETLLVNALNGAIPTGNTSYNAWIGKPFPQFTDISWFDEKTKIFEIKTAAQLFGVSKLVNGGAKDGIFAGKTITLANDIDLAGMAWTPIGKYIDMTSPNNRPFNGTFDGKGYVIQNVNVNVSGNYVGLFAYASSASFRNLGVAGGSVKGKQYTGGLVGYATGSTFTNCYVEGIAVEGTYYIGGLTAYNSSSTITNCHSNATVSGTNNVGGLTGRIASASTVINCYNSGSVTSNYTTNASCGGLAGSSEGTGSIFINCYNSGGVSDNNSNVVGGLIGTTYADTYLFNCYWLQDGGSTPTDIGDNNATRTACYPFNTSAVLQDGKNTPLCDALNNGLPWGVADCNAWTTSGSSYPLFSADKAITANTEWYNESDSSFIISSAIQLAGLAQLVNGGTDSFKDKAITLAKDIDLEGRLWTPVGTGPNGSVFCGTIEGNGKMIQNLNINKSSIYTGLFGYASGASFRNLGIAGGNVKGADNIGGFVGGASSVTFTNCYNKATVQGASNVGGFVGGVPYGGTSTTLTNCYNSGAVSGSGSNIGSLAGSAVEAYLTFAGCYWLEGGELKAVGNNADTPEGCTSFTTESESLSALLSSLNTWVIGNSTPTAYAPWMIDEEATSAIPVHDTDWAYTVIEGGANTEQNLLFSSLFTQEGSTFADATSITLRGNWSETNLGRLSGVFTNPNCLRFVPLVGTAMPEGYDCSNGNFILEDADGTYQAQGNIALTDVGSFHTPYKFSMNGHNVSYTRTWTFAQRDAKGNGYGWNALTVPFTGNVYVDGVVKAHFTSNEDTNGTYWLKRFDGMGTEDEATVVFKHEETAGIQANIPYIIALPGATFGSANMEAAELVTIKATGITVPATPKGVIVDATKADAAYQYIGNYTPVSEVGIYRLARGTTGTGDNVTPVEAFLQVEVKDDAPALKPFRAYFKAKAGSNARRLVIGDGNGSTGITLPTINNDDDSNNANKPRKVMTKEGIRIIVGDRVYTVDGRMVELTN